MIFIDFFKFFQPTKTPNGSTKIRHNYICKDPDLTNIIQDLLSSNIDAEECLLLIINQIAYQKKYHDPDTCIIFSVLKDFLSTATWRSCPEDEYLYFESFKNKKTLDVLHQFFEFLIYNIETAESVLHDVDEKDSKEVYETVLRTLELTSESLLNKQLYIAKKATICDLLDSNQYTPLDLVQIIEDNWILMCKSESIYHVLEYSIIMSETHNISACFAADIRNLGHVLSTIFSENEEKKGLQE